MNEDGNITQYIKVAFILILCEYFSKRSIAKWTDHDRNERFRTTQLVVKSNSLKKPSKRVKSLTSCDALVLFSQTVDVILSAKKENTNSALNF